MGPPPPLVSSTTLGRADNYPLENFKRGTRVWVRDEERVWVMGELVDDLSFSTTSVQIRLLTPTSNDHNDTTIHYDVLASPMPFLCNPEILLGRDDLTALSYLHEPAVLHNLQHRFAEQETIYTYCGIVLVAINPYCECPHLYNDDVIQVYRGQGKQVRDLLPHIYAIAEEAYFDLCEYGKNQSVVISGESGAGKTVSARFVMAYLASVAAAGSPTLTRQLHPSNGMARGGIEQRVLASNPIMEAIGNAKTMRNDNSSRFGKFIQINFGDGQPAASGRIVGAKMSTYLLEKSRVVFHSAGERNYHIFYQLCAAAASGHPLLDGLALGPPANFHYTSTGSGQRELGVEGVDDGREFALTLKSFDTLAIGGGEQADVLRLLATILHLGNVNFVTSLGPPGERITISAASAMTVEKLCSAELLHLDAEFLSLWLCHREIRAGGDTVRKALSVEEALTNRDALAKALYANLFQWLVARINASLGNSDGSAKSGKGRFIGVLDIYGFETFDTNSFEQFCINYANEKLQQQFNQHVFKLEQAEYEREGISWIRIDFQDNQACINLIEARPRSLIDYLDEQCKIMGRGSDAGWLEQTRQCPHLRANDHLELSKAARDASFVVKHFAADVCYSVDGFVEKNKDTVNEQLLEVIGTSRFDFLREVMRDALATSTSGATRKRTVAVQFRESLRDLIQVISSTRPHYVRCIKPNDAKERFNFEPRRAIQQLRACGVLETVRISAAGFPSRWRYEDFVHRYRVLLVTASTTGAEKVKQDAREYVNRVCEKWLEAGKFALGKTKVFFRTGQVAKLEKIRKEVLSASATAIQAAWRGHHARQRFHKLKDALSTIQCALRAYLAMRRMEELRWRRRTFHQVDTTILALQTHWRAGKVRQQVMQIRHERMVVDLQRYARGWLARRRFYASLRSIILAQCCVRRWLAKRRLKELKAEARTVAGVKKANQGLEMKIITLQQRLDAETSEKRRLTILLDRLNATALREIYQVKRGFYEMRREVSDSSDEATSMVGKCGDQVLDEMRISDKRSLELASLLLTQRAELERLLNSNTELEKKMLVLEEQLQSSNETVVGEGMLGTLQSTIDSSSESASIARLEQDLEATRKQLESNAHILASPGIGIGGQQRRDAEEQSLADAEMDAARQMGLELAVDQKNLITELRLKLDASETELAAVRRKLHLYEITEGGGGNAERQLAQDMEMELTKSRDEMRQLLARFSDASDVETHIVEQLERKQEENDRLRDENRELRYTLTKQFDRRSTLICSPQSSRQRQDKDSGHWSTTDNGSSSSTTAGSNSPSPQGDPAEAESLIDRLIYLEGVQRKYKQLLELDGKEMGEKDSTIAELRAQLAALTQTPAPNGICDHHLDELLNENVRNLSRREEELAETKAQLRGHLAVGFTRGDGEIRIKGEGSAAKISPFSALRDSQRSRGGEITRLESLNKGTVVHSGLLEVFNVPEFVRILIDDLKPQLAKRLPPRLPAHLLLCALRFFDRAGDDMALTGLFNSFHAALKAHIVDSCCELDSLSLWLVNCWCLLDSLATCDNGNSGCNGSSAEGNYDLGPIGEQLSYRVDELYANLMKRAVEPLLLPKVVPAILQHESWELRQLLHPSSSSDFSGPANGKCVTRGNELDDLLELLSFIHRKLEDFGAEPALTEQIFRQLARWICASALNRLLFSKELCTSNRAISIRHNVGEVQAWLHERKLPAIVADTLEPLVQACHLLQMPKSERNVKDLCGEVTNRLGRRQVLALLKNFTPCDAFGEECIGDELLRKVDASLQERHTGDEVGAEDELLMRGTCLAPLDHRRHAPCGEESAKLKSLSLPKCLNHLARISRMVQDEINILDIELFMAHIEGAVAGRTSRDY